MSFLTDPFSTIMNKITGKNPADKAMPYLNQIPGMEKGYLEPYINQGQSQYGNLNQQYGEMGSDPAAFLEKLMGSYQPSQAFQMKNKNALQAAGNTAAAGGYRGTGNDMNNEGAISNTLMNEDMQQWLSNVLGIQGTGLQGEQGLYNTGFNASTGLSGDLSNVLGTQASLGFQGQSQKNQNQTDLLKSLLGMLGGGASKAGGGFI
jgi:hypothetical protein